MNGLEVAVIGMSGRFPMANSLNEYWNNLLQRKECITRNLRKPESTQKSKSLQDELYVNAKGIIDEDGFDASLFGIKEEQDLMDPQLKLLLTLSKSALENSKYDFLINDNCVGVYISCSSSFNWRNHILSQSNIANSLNTYERYKLSLIAEENYYASQIAYRLNLSGPSVTILSACSSSLIAVHSACRALLTGECNTAIAGGVSIVYPQHTGYYYSDQMMYSRKGQCRPFDIEADGTVPGSGGGIVALKLLEQAIDDKDEIYCIIKASSINNDGNKKMSFTAPSLDGQVKVIRSAYELAEIDTEHVNFIESHGAGTPLGDAIEVEALTKAFNTNKTGYCAIGSVKSNIGYLDVASGISAFIKAALCVKHRRYPANINFSSPNSNINFIESPFMLNTSLIDFSELSKPVVGGVSSFGDGGANVHIVIEEFTGI